MKKIITIIFTTLTILTAQAQQNKIEELKPIIGIGLCGGINFSKFAYSNSVYNSFDKDKLINPQFGIRSEIYIGKLFSVSPTFLYTNRGEKISTATNYLLSSKNFDIAIPLSITFGHKRIIRPFLSIAPVFEFTKGGIIGIEDISTNITKANHSLFSFGVTPSLGLKFFLSEKMYISLEGGYHLGLSNTYSDMELSGSADALNAGTYTIKGARKNRAPEVMVSLIFLINKSHKEIITVDDLDEEIIDNITIIDIEPEKMNIIIEEKANYTIDEIEKYIHDGVDVTNRKISFDNIEFEFNKSDLKDGSELVLNDIVDFIKKNPKVNIQINGHTDNVGSSDVNIKLSNGRAKAVCDYLISSGIKQNRITYKGFGDTKPIASNDMESDRAKNRRVEFQIISH